MLFSIVVTLMVILVAAFWAYQGFFSSFIMFLETVVACLVAFAFYEAVNGLWVDSIGMGIGLPLALLAVFLVVLFGLRMATDRLIPGNVTMPMALDRAGGGICGFFTGMLLIGTALVGIQMLPIGPTIFGYDRLVAQEETGDIEEGNLSLFKPDRFAVAMVIMLSNERFGGENPLGEQKPDMVSQLYSGRAVTQTESRVFLEKDDLKVRAYWQTDKIDRVTHALEGDVMVRSFTEEQPQPHRGSNGEPTKILVCAVTVAGKAAPEKESAIRFRLPQFRIIGWPRGKNVGGDQAVYYAIGMSDIYTHKKHGPTIVDEKQRARLVRFSPTTNFILSDKHTKVLTRGKDFEFDVAFEVPADFDPSYMEFKRGAQADLERIKPADEPPSFASLALGDSGPSGKVKIEKPKVGAAAGGTIHVGNAIEQRTGVSSQLPLPLDVNDESVARFVRNKKIAGGDNCHFWCIPRTWKLSDSEQITEFNVPSGKRMFQVGFDQNMPESMYGKAVNWASRVTAQVRIVDANGTEYFAIGYYAAVETEGFWHLELQYYPKAEIPERCLKKDAKKVTHNLIKQAGREKSKQGFLFLVNSGIHIVKFKSGRASQDLDFLVP